MRYPLEQPEEKREYVEEHQQSEWDNEIIMNAEGNRLCH